MKVFIVGDGVFVVVFLERKKPPDVVPAQKQNQGGKNPGDPAVAVNKRVDPDQFVVGDAGFYHRVQAVAVVAVDPVQKLAHQKWYFQWRGRPKGDLAGGRISHDDLFVPEFPQALGSQNFFGDDAVDFFD